MTIFFDKTEKLGLIIDILKFRMVIFLSIMINAQQHVTTLFKL